MSISQSSLPLEPGVALASWRSEPNKHKNGHSWLQPLLPHGPPFVPHSDTRSPAPSPAACCSLKLLFTYIHLPVSSWVLDIRVAGPGRQEADTPVSSLGGSRTVLWLVSPPPGLFPSPCTHSSLYLPQVILITQRPVVFVGFHPLLIKPIFIQYAGRECGSATYTMSYMRRSSKHSARCLPALGILWQGC